ncbi:MAG: sulfur carrier protein ThiS [Burkholderiaceae bacterium]
MTTQNSADISNGIPCDGSKEIELNGAPHRIKGDCTLQNLVEGLGLTQQVLAVAVNREVVPRPFWGKCLLQPKDRVDLVRPIGGG